MKPLSFIRHVSGYSAKSKNRITLKMTQSVVCEIDLDTFQATAARDNKVSLRKYPTAVVGDHNDVIKWKHLPCNWPFVRGIHR